MACVAAPGTRWRRGSFARMSRWRRGRLCWLTLAHMVQAQTSANLRWQGERQTFLSHSKLLFLHIHAHTNRGVFTPPFPQHLIPNSFHPLMALCALCVTELLLINICFTSFGTERDPADPGRRPNPHKIRANRGHHLVSNRGSKCL